MSDKLSDYARSDFNVDQRRVSSEEIGEFYYTFNKASAFASSTPAQDQRASHRDFLELLAAYDMFVRHADAYRLAGKRDATVLDSLQSDHEMVKRLAKKVTADLRAEQG
ncbi:MAG: hypothetical protein JWM69_919 [Candidatus Binatus sp.]|jgi:hypothetical protein|nr:hypothetical protein [Candidatus Binatus sp.]